MEQARYWMWTNGKHDFGSRVFAAAAQNNNPPSYGDDSWEEQAFAEDAAGALGGCVWPPRSYTCSFCRREFKSAQALGGHMNVHRRDRARLKQHGGGGAGAGDALPHSHNNNINLNPLDVPQQYSPTLLYNHSSINSDHHQERRFRVSISSSPPPPPPLIFSSILSENCLKRKSCDMSSPDQSGSNLVADKFFSVSDWSKGDNKSSFKTSKSNHHDGRANKAKEDEESVKADLNLLLCRNHSNHHHHHHHVSSEEDDDLQFPSCNKRRRTDHRHHDEITSSNSHFLSSKQSFPVLERYCKIPLTSSDVPKLMSPNPIGDLDLELRLGDPPKVHVK